MDSSSPGPKSVPDVRKECRGEGLSVLRQCRTSVKGVAGKSWARDGHATCVGGIKDETILAIVNFETRVSLQFASRAPHPKPCIISASNASNIFWR